MSRKKPGGGVYEDVFSLDVQAASEIWPGEPPEIYATLKTMSSKGTYAKSLCKMPTGSILFWKFNMDTQNDVFCL